MMNFSSITLLVCICMEACIFLNKYNLWFHTLPLFLLLVERNLISKLKHHTYLVDYSCLSPRNSLRVPKSVHIEHLHLSGFYNKESLDFMSKVIRSSGQGDTASLPPAFYYLPPKFEHKEFITESHMNLFPVFQNLLSKTNLFPTDIDILVVNCSTFYPSPSLSSILVNRFKMRPDIKSFNLSGMGCSGGSIAIDLASRLLNRKMKYAAVVSTEILSPMWYTGQDRSKQLLNCTFKTGSSAVLLTNNAAVKAKYKLLHLVRTTGAYDDLAHGVAKLEDDSEGKIGFTVRRDILHVVREVVRSNALSLGKRMLPFDEVVRYVVWCVMRRVRGEKRSEQVFVPDFGRVAQHYCLPLIGKAVIGGIGGGLGLREEDMEAALTTFHRFGNQSSPSWWYQLGYLEAKGRVRKGDNVWQVAFGSGCKCNSVVWKCVGDTKEDGHEDGVWSRLIKE